LKKWELKGHRESGWENGKRGEGKILAMTKKENSTRNCWEKKNETRSQRTSTKNPFGKRWWRNIGHNTEQIEGGKSTEKKKKKKKPYISTVGCESGPSRKRCELKQERWDPSKKTGKPERLNKSTTVDREKFHPPTVRNPKQTQGKNGGEKGGGRGNSKSRNFLKKGRQGFSISLGSSNGRTQKKGKRERLKSFCSQGVLWKKKPQEESKGGGGTEHSERSAVKIQIRGRNGEKKMGLEGAAKLNGKTHKKKRTALRGQPE